MNLDWLRTFIHVADAGSLTRASETLHLSQPAVSRQLKLLAEEVQEVLLVRTGRGVKLTATGEALQALARPLLEEIERLPERLRDESRIISGTVRFATPPSLGTAWIADMVEEVRRAYPQVRLITKVALSGAVRSGLVRGKLDLGIVYSQLDTPQLKGTELWQEELLFVERRGDASSEEIPLQVALSKPLILPGASHGLRSIAEHAAAAHGFRLDVVVEVESLRVQTELIARGLGASILPLRAVAPAVSAGRLQTRPTVPQLTRRLRMAWPADRLQSAATTAVLNVVLENAHTWSTS